VVTLADFFDDVEAIFSRELTFPVLTLVFGLIDCLYLEPLLLDLGDTLAASSMSEVCRLEVVLHAFVTVLVGHFALLDGGTDLADLHVAPLAVLLAEAAFDALVVLIH